ncbi:MAG: DJ-1/PfpI family protein [bacterium]|nr:DJ-1/PfpI family protein [bacterium]
METKTVFLFLADGFEMIEALTVVDLCRRAGIPIGTVSIMGKKEVKSSHNVVVTADLLYEEVDFASASMLILPGGKLGTEHLEAYEPLMERLDAWNEAGKDIAAICAAPSIFAHRGYLKGKDACSYPSFEEHLTAGGARVSQNEVTVSGHIIMARGMGCSIPFGLAIVEHFAGKETAEKIKTSIVYEQRA